MIYKIGQETKPTIMPIARKSSIFDSPLKDMFPKATPVIRATSVQIESITKEHDDIIERSIQLEREIKMTDAGYASVIHEGLMDTVRDFESGLASDEEIGARLASFGSSTLIRVHSITYRNPFLIIFHGTALNDGSSRVQLVQHTTQLNVLLTALKVEDASQPPRRIGFAAIRGVDENET